MLGIKLFIINIIIGVPIIVYIQNGGFYVIHKNKRGSEIINVIIKFYSSSK